MQNIVIESKVRAGLRTRIGYILVFEFIYSYITIKKSFFSFDWTMWPYIPDGCLSYYKKILSRIFTVSVALHRCIASFYYMQCIELSLIPDWKEWGNKNRRTVKTHRSSPRSCITNLSFGCFCRSAEERYRKYFFRKLIVLGTDIFIDKSSAIRHSAEESISCLVVVFNIRCSI